MCEECYSDENRITTKSFGLLRTTLNMFVELVDVVFVLNMTQTEDCKGGIFLLSHWKLQNFIYVQPITQRKDHVVFMR